jgi:hypothetical protein
MSTDTDTVPRPDWRDGLALAADLALLGILTTLACLPAVTAGAALATASVAADHACVHRGLPPSAALGRTLWRALLPGLGVTAGAAAAVALLVIDMRALAAGIVPGGWPLVAVTIAVSVAALAVACLRWSGWDRPADRAGDRLCGAAPRRPARLRRAGPARDGAGGRHRGRHPGLHGADAGLPPLRAPGGRPHERGDYSA